MARGAPLSAATTSLARGLLAALALSLPLGAAPRAEAAPARRGAAEHRDLDFELYDLSDRLVSLKRLRLRSQLVVVDFFSTSCSPCRRALPTWRRLLKRHARAGLALVVVAVPDGGEDRSEALARVQRFFAGQPDGLPVVWDKYSLVARRYGVARDGSFKLPQVFLLDPGGRLLLRAVEPGPVEAEIKRRLAPRRPASAR